MKKEFDIEKRTFAFSLEIIKLANKVNHNLENTIILKQLIRCATSVGANVHEAKGGHTKKDFINYHSIALKSANETGYWLRLLSVTNTTLEANIDPLVSEAEELAKIIASIRNNSQKVKNHKKFTLYNNQYIIPSNVENFEELTQLTQEELDIVNSFNTTKCKEL